ncbi:MAG: glycosyltransferase family 2 protein [Bryobacterales bacterium]|nr:glycosyltransferase family 2 protein [Bryobacterales bacterium]
MTSKAQRKTEGLLGVVIVTYNSAHVLSACLRSLARYDLPVVVVDNGSDDETLAIGAEFGVTLLPNGTNEGFAAATNQGIALLDRPYVLLLNPDVALLASPIELLDAFRGARVAAVSATLLGEDGQPQFRFQYRRFPRPLTLIAENLGVNRLWPANALNRRYRYADGQWEQATMVEQPAGAFLLLRRSAWEELGGFDERFWPLWFEDVDFCLRLRRNGYEVWHIPRKAGVHVGGHSIHRLDPEIRQLYWYRSLLQYSAKHFPGFWVRMIGLSVLLGAMGKALLRVSCSRRRSVSSGVQPLMALGLEAALHGRPPSGRPVPDNTESRHET